MAMMGVKDTKEMKEGRKRGRNEDETEERKKKKNQKKEMALRCLRVDNHAVFHSVQVTGCLSRRLVLLTKCGFVYHVLYSSIWFWF